MFTVELHHVAAFLIFEAFEEFVHDLMFETVDAHIRPVVSDKLVYPGRVFPCTLQT